jgi:hypothetical protein
MRLCRIMRLRHGLCVDTVVRRRRAGTGETARHRVPGGMFIDVTAPRRDAMEASHEH